MTDEANTPLPPDTEVDREPVATIALRVVVNGPWGPAGTSFLINDTDLSPTEKWHLDKGNLALIPTSRT